LTPQNHQPYTNAWRQELPYRKPGGPSTCYTEAQVLAAIAVVYQNDPEILDFVKKAWEGGTWP